MSKPWLRVIVVEVARHFNEAKVEAEAEAAFLSSIRPRHPKPYVSGVPHNR
jgi:hypothetical protein